jgi:hypothetical protein
MSVHMAVHRYRTLFGLFSWLVDHTGLCLGHMTDSVVHPLLSHAVVLLVYRLAVPARIHQSVCSLSLVDHQGSAGLAPQHPLPLKVQLAKTSSAFRLLRRTAHGNGFGWLSIPLVTSTFGMSSFPSACFACTTSLLASSVETIRNRLVSAMNRPGQIRLPKSKYLCSQRGRSPLTSWPEPLGRQVLRGRR